MEFMVRSPLCEWSTTHRQSCRSHLSSGMLPLPVHVLTLKRFARNAFFSQNWCTHVTFWSISTFRHSYQHARKTQSSFLFLCIYLFIFVPLIFKYHLLLCRVLNRAKGTVGGLHLFPVWSWWGCWGFGQSSSRKQSCESAGRRLPLLTHKELFNAADSSHTWGALSHPCLLQTPLFPVMVFGSQASPLE